MTSKKTSPKKPIWHTESEEEIEKGRAEFNQRILNNINVAKKLKKQTDALEAKSISAPAFPSSKIFLKTTYLHKLDHVESLELFRYVIEQLIELDKQLAIKLQYLEDNIQTVAEKSGAELKTMKDNMAVFHKNTMTIYSMVKELGKQEREETEEDWRDVQRKNSYVS